MQAEPLPGPCPRSTDTRARPSRDGRTSTSTPLQNGSWVHLNRQLGKQGREAGQELAAADRCIQVGKIDAYRCMACSRWSGSCLMQVYNTRTQGKMAHCSVPSRRAGSAYLAAGSTHLSSAFSGGE